jgi:serine/threonine-protein kinase HipA
VATGNGDAHLKNWSLIYPDKVQAAWAPLYDQVATVAWPETDRELSLKLRGVKKFGEVDRASFQRLADRVELDRSRLDPMIDETLDRLRQGWRELQKDLPLVSEHRQAVEEHWRRVPLLREAGGLD